VDVDLPGQSVEIVFETAARFVLGIEIKKSERDVIGEKPFRQMNHEACLPDSAFAALGEDNSFMWLGCMECYLF
jgi:hypothetical protein